MCLPRSGAIAEPGQTHRSAPTLRSARKIAGRKSIWRYQALAALFSLFQRSPAPEDATDTIDQPDDEESNHSRIRCPLCRWQPDEWSLWGCGDCEHPEYFFGGCGMEWNTFDTRGLCPGCGHQWRWTACLSCEGWSLHEDWYAKDGE